MILRNKIYLFLNKKILKKEKYNLYKNKISFVDTILPKYIKVENKDKISDNIKYENNENPNYLEEYDQNMYPKYNMRNIKDFLSKELNNNKQTEKNEKNIYVFFEENIEKSEIIIFILPEKNKKDDLVSPVSLIIPITTDTKENELKKLNEKIYLIQSTLSNEKTYIYISEEDINNNKEFFENIDNKVKINKDLMKEAFLRVNYKEKIKNQSLFKGLSFIIIPFIIFFSFYNFFYDDLISSNKKEKSIAQKKKIKTKIELVKFQKSYEELSKKIKNLKYYTKR